MKVVGSSLNQFAVQLKLSAPKSMPIHWLTHLFGCWHKKMGTPFTRGSQTYRTCMECGAHRKFDMARRKNTGPYYHYPVTALYESPSRIKIINKSDGVSIPEMSRWLDDDGKN